jgi:hypothetical protein
MRKKTFIPCTSKLLFDGPLNGLVYILVYTFSRSAVQLDSDSAKRPLKFMALSFSFPLHTEWWAT